MIKPKKINENDYITLMNGLWNKKAENEEEAVRNTRQKNYDDYNMC